jgi:hypothetical protein
MLHAATGRGLLNPRDCAFRTFYETGMAYLPATTFRSCRGPCSPLLPRLARNLVELKKLAAIAGLAYQHALAKQLSCRRLFIGARNRYSKATAMIASMAPRGVLLHIDGIFDFPSCAFPHACGGERNPEISPALNRSNSAMTR